MDIDAWTPEIWTQKPKMRIYARLQRLFNERDYLNM